MRNRHATAVAYLALFVALGGSSYAAVKITGKQIKDGTITGRDVKNRSLGANDFKPGQLPSGAQVPQGAQGPQGPRGDTGAAGRDGAPGQDGSAKGYINVPNNAPDDTEVDNPPRAKGVLAYEKVLSSPSHVTYCFDLAFDPEVAVASPFANNNAIVATSVGHDFGTTVSGCPSPLNDAKAIVRDTANAEHGDVRFSIMFN